MKKIIASLVAAAAVALPAQSDPIRENEYNTHHSMGCMMMRECLDKVDQILSTDDLTEKLGSDYSQYQEEIDGIITELKKMGVDVYLASDHYFVRGTAGIYYTVGNDFFLNETYVVNPHQLIKTLRHEAWHAAQDAMAGSIDNSLIAIIRNEEDVPQAYVLQAEIAYGNTPVLAWEKEAKWAGSTPNMTLDVLRIINETNGRPWEVLEPTPMTRQYLVNEGYIE